MTFWVDMDHIVYPVFYEQSVVWCSTNHKYLPHEEIQKAVPVSLKVHSISLSKKWVLKDISVILGILRARYAIMEWKIYKTLLLWMIKILWGTGLQGFWSSKTHFKIQLKRVNWYRNPCKGEKTRTRRIIYIPGGALGKFDKNRFSTKLLSTHRSSWYLTARRS